MNKEFRSRLCGISLAVAMAMLTACGAAGEESVVESFASSETVSDATESSQTDIDATKSSQEDIGATETQPEYATKLHITINPDMALYLDEADSVVFVEYLNEDAEKAYAGTDMTGVTLNEAIDVIVDIAVTEGYLTEGKTISVDVVECAEEKEEELTTQLQTSVQEAVA